MPRIGQEIKKKNSRYRKVLPAEKVQMFKVDPSCIKMIELLMITGITFQNFRLSKYFSLTENIRKLRLLDYAAAIIVNEVEFQTLKRWMQKDVIFNQDFNLTAKLPGGELTVQCHHNQSEVSILSKFLKNGNIPTFGPELSSGVFAICSVSKSFTFRL